MNFTLSETQKTDFLVLWVICFIINLLSMGSYFEFIISWVLLNRNVSNNQMFVSEMTIFHRVSVIEEHDNK